MIFSKAQNDKLLASAQKKDGDFYLFFLFHSQSDDLVSFISTHILKGCGLYRTLKKLSRPKTSFNLVFSEFCWTSVWETCTELFFASDKILTNKFYITEKPHWIFVSLWICRGFLQCSTPTPIFLQSWKAGVTFLVWRIYLDECAVSSMNLYHFRNTACLIIRKKCW